MQNSTKKRIAEFYAQFEQELLVIRNDYDISVARLIERHMPIGMSNADEDLLLTRAKDEVQYPTYETVREQFDNLV